MALMTLTRLIVVLVSILPVAVTAAHGQINWPISADKLVITDKFAAAGRARVAFLARDDGIQKGGGEGTSQVAARLDIAYNSAYGAFIAPSGPFTGTAGWRVNTPTLAKFANFFAPGGPSEVSRILVKHGKILRLIARGRGDVAIDIAGAGPPSGSVYAAFTVENPFVAFCEGLPMMPCVSDANCPSGVPCAELSYSPQYCVEFPLGSCKYRTIAGGTGAKLVCRNAIPDPTCAAVP